MWNADRQRFQPEANRFELDVGKLTNEEVAAKYGRTVEPEEEGVTEESSHERAGARSVAMSEPDCESRSLMRYLFGALLLVLYDSSRADFNASLMAKFCRVPLGGGG